MWRSMISSNVGEVLAARRTPVPCGQSRETVRRSEFAGYGGYGYCRSHSRFFWAPAALHGSPWMAELTLR
jgi:hypothetical protein